MRKAPFFSLSAAVFAVLVTASCGPTSNSLLRDVKVPTDNAARVASVINGLERSIGSCGSKLWPDYSWTGVSLYMTDTEARQAWLWRIGEQVRSVSFDHVDPEFLAGLFTIKNEATAKELGLSLNLSREFNINHGGRLDFLVSLGLHEGFHGFAQRSWTSDGNVKSSRDTDFPLLWAPRYLRYAMTKSLFDYLTDRRPEQLAKARAFLDRYLKEHGDEAQAIAQTDVFEGSAFYVEHVGEALAEHGCDASEATLVNQAARTMPAHRLEVATEADSESYLLHGLASLILRTLPENQGWERQVEAGKTPLSILLESVAPAAATDDPVAVKDATDRIAAANVEIAKAIDPYLAAVGSAEKIRAVIPSQRLQGSYGTSGTIYHKATSRRLMLSFDGSFSLRDQASGKLDIRGVTVEYLHARGNPCGEADDYAYQFTIPKSVVPAAAKGKLDYQDTGFDIKNAPYESQIDKQGVRWICL